ncbi:MAG: L7Ae/L30e/S12e/Gadd45 family ribosomal protein [Acutalibacteraceae bacterium]
MNDRVLSLMGLMRKAGKISIGADPTVDSAKNGKSSLVVFAKDLSENTRKTVLKNINPYGIPLLTAPRTKDEISFAVGKTCGVFSVEDKGFADKLQKVISDETIREELL